MGIVRLVFSLAVVKSWPLWQMDLYYAFLLEYLEGEAYMQIREGFYQSTARSDPPRFCWLKKSLYGLKQTSM